MKKRISRALYVLCSIGLCMLLTSCDIPGITSSMNYDNNKTNNEAAGEDNQTTPEGEDASKHIPKNKKMHKMGEEVDLIDFTCDNVNKKYATVIINKAQIFDNVKDTGIDRSLFSPASIYMKLSPLEPRLKMVEDYENTKILMVDITLRCEQWYIDERTELSGNQDFFPLDLIMVSGKNYVRMGDLCYFSKSVADAADSDYPLFSPESGDMNMKVGWPIDPKLYDLDKLELDKVCLAQPGDDSFFQYIGLNRDLSGELIR